MGTNAPLEDVLRRLESLRDDLLELEAAHRDALDAVPADARPSARNLLHYLALRRHDVRPLQGDLWRWGLSSLGRAEAQVLANLDAVRRAVQRMLGRSPNEGVGDGGGAPGDELDVGEGSSLLQERANRALGPLTGDRASRIMVTMPSDAGRDPGLVHRLARAGMGIARINTAHDDAVTWKAIADRVREAERDTGRRLLIAFDLAGPKLRTGPVGEGPQVLRVRPRRDELGGVRAPARVALVSGPDVAPRAAEAGTPHVPVVGAGGRDGTDLLRSARPGDRLRLIDARGRRRRFRVDEVVQGQGGGVSVTVEGDRTTYLVPGLRLELVRGDETVGYAELGPLPPREAPILLGVGDRLRVDRDPAPGTNAVRDADGRVVRAARVSCPVGEVFRDARVGQRILFDDGEIQGLIRGADGDGLDVETTRVAGGVGKLRGEKGINLPDTALNVPALTDEDRAHLAAVVKHADLVSMSFVQRPEDVDDLVDALDGLGRSDVGIVLKIETSRGFRTLPGILFRALQRRSDVAVMLARGDLAVEVGFERLAELQEEILWLAEAAHIPTIWATQVLESLAKTGVPSRAEVTDAMAGTRAECVMLNKGPHVDEAVEFLVDVIARSRGHQEKKRPMLRRLRVADFDRL